MFIIVTAIKKKFYDIITALGYTVVDNKESITEETPFPQIILRINTASRDRIKDVVINKLRFSIDIFSLYDGEAEILDIEQKIFDATRELYDIDNVVYVQESSFRVLDDKSTGVVMKHGVIHYMIVSSGLEREVEDEQTNSTP